MMFSRAVLTKLPFVVSGLLMIMTSCKSTQSGSAEAEVKDAYFDQTKMPSNARIIATCADTTGWNNGKLVASLTLYDAEKNGKHYLYAWGKTAGEAFSFAGPAAYGSSYDGATSIEFQPSGVLSFSKLNVKGKKISGLVFRSTASKTESWATGKQQIIPIPANSIEFQPDTGGLESAGGSPEMSHWSERSIQVTCKTIPSVSDLSRLVPAGRFNQ